MKTLMTLFFWLTCTIVYGQQITVADENGNVLTTLDNNSELFTAPQNGTFTFSGIRDFGHFQAPMSIRILLRKGQTLSPISITSTDVVETRLKEASSSQQNVANRWTFQDVLNYKIEDGQLISVQKVFRPTNVTIKETPDLFLVWKREDQYGNTTSIAEPFRYTPDMNGDIESWPLAGFGLLGVKCKGVNCSNCSILGMWNPRNQGCDCLRIGHEDAGPSYCESEVSMGILGNVVLGSEVVKLLTIE